MGLLQSIEDYVQKQVHVAVSHINSRLGLIIRNQGAIMSTLADLGNILNIVVTKVSMLKDDVAGLEAKLAAVPPAGLTADQQTALDAAVQQASTIATNLDEIHGTITPAAPASAAPTSP